jgi:shikimate kinase
VIEVGMTVNAVEVETQSGKPVMLGFKSPSALAVSSASA